MRCINVVTINGQREDERDLVKIVEDAKIYFPTKTWPNVKYLGELCLKHDVEIATSDGKSYGTFLLKKLVERIRRLEDAKLASLLLGITPDPVVTAYYFFEGKHFKRILYFVHDYVAAKLGVVSLFRVNEESARKVVAHGLGHNRGLRHHVKPIDLMYSELLRSPKLQTEGFCKPCLRKLDMNA